MNAFTEKILSYGALALFSLPGVGKNSVLNTVVGDIRLERGASALVITPRRSDRLKFNNTRVELCVNFAPCVIKEIPLRGESVVVIDGYSLADMTREVCEVVSHFKRRGVRVVISDSLPRYPFARGVNNRPDLSALGELRSVAEGVDGVALLYGDRLYNGARRGCRNGELCFFDGGASGEVFFLTCDLIRGFACDRVAAQ